MFLVLVAKIAARKNAEAIVGMGRIMKEITVVVVEPMKQPRIANVKNELSEFQKIVEGLIEIYPVGHLEVVLNEEGKLSGLIPNRKINNEIICGTFFISKANDKGEFISLNEDEVNVLLKRFEEIETYTETEVIESMFIKFICN